MDATLDKVYVLSQKIAPSVAAEGVVNLASRLYASVLESRKFFTDDFTYGICRKAGFWRAISREPHCRSLTCFELVLGFVEDFVGLVEESCHLQESACRVRIQCGAL
jgi:hypothetical protein